MAKFVVVCISGPRGDLRVIGDPSGLPMDEYKARRLAKVITKHITGVTAVVVPVEPGPENEAYRSDGGNVDQTRS